MVRLDADLADLKVQKCSQILFLDFQHEMVNLDLNEYSVIDDVLSDLKVTPDKIELPIPAYYTKVGQHLTISKPKTTFAIMAK